MSTRALSEPTCAETDVTYVVAHAIAAWVRAISECQLVLCLAPWPSLGHPSQPATT